MDTWLVEIWNVIKNTAVAIATFIANLGTRIWEADFDKPSTGWLIFWLVLFGLCAFSACYAQSVALCRRHKTCKHLFLGFIMPIGYPIYLLFNLPIHGDQEIKAMLTERKEERLKEEEEERQKAEAKQERLNPNRPKAKWGPDFFNGIARLPDGSYAGPWNVVYNDTPMNILRILDVQENFVQVEVRGDEGALFNIRMPYEKITEWNQ